MIIQLELIFKRILKKLFAIFKQPYQLNQWSYGFVFLSTHYPHVLKNSWIGIEMTEWWTNIWVAVANLHQSKSIGKDYFWYLVIPTG